MEINFVANHTPPPAMKNMKSSTDQSATTIWKSPLPTKSTHTTTTAKDTPIESMPASCKSHPQPA